MTSIQMTSIQALRGLALLLAAPGAAQIPIDTWDNPDGEFGIEFREFVSCDSGRVAVGTTTVVQGHRVSVLDAATGDVLAVVPALTDPPLGNGGTPTLDGDLEGNRLLVGSPADQTGGISSGAAWIFDATTGGQICQLAAPAPANGDAFGNGVALFGNRALVGAPCDDDDATDAGAAYLFDADTGQLLFELHASNPGPDNGFGWDVALDANFALVGAPFFGGGNKGQAYVYDVATGVELQRLQPDVPMANYQFGYSVSTWAGRGVVGAPVGAVCGIGRAFVFDLATGTQLQELAASLGFSCSFGTGVSIDQDTILVGAPEDSGGQQGRVYAFDPATGTQVAVWGPGPLKILGFGDDHYGERVSVDPSGPLAAALSDGFVAPSNRQGCVFSFDTTTLLTTGPVGLVNGPWYDRFGERVVADGDHVVVASQDDDEFGYETGSALVYDRGTGALVARLDAPLIDPSNSTSFGPTRPAVGLGGGRAIVGVRNAEGPGDLSWADYGEAHVLDPDTGAKLMELSAPDLQLGDEFGGAVAIDDDCAVVSALFGNSAAAANSGAVYVFDLPSGSLRYRLEPLAAVPDMEFGYSLALDGGRLLVGAPEFPSPAYLFDVSTGDLLALLPPTLSDPFYKYGTDVALCGTRALVSAPQQGDGVVYVFDAVTGELLFELQAPCCSQTSFGQSVAIDGDLILAGAPGGGQTATVFAFSASSGLSLFQLTVSGLSVGDCFGCAVALDGDRAWVGASGVDDVTTNAGAVYVFDVPNPPTAIPYCEATVSDAGCDAAIEVLGPGPAPTSGAADWAVGCQGVEGNRPGLLIGGYGGPASIPFSGGTLCFELPVKRGGSRYSFGTPGSCDGSFQDVVNAAAVPNGFDPGSGNTAWFQWWYRNSPGAAQPAALSNALAVPYL